MARDEEAAIGGRLEAFTILVVGTTPDEGVPAVDERAGICETHDEHVSSPMLGLTTQGRRVCVSHDPNIAVGGTPNRAAAASLQACPPMSARTIELHQEGVSQARNAEPMQSRAGRVANHILPVTSNFRSSA